MRRLLGKELGVSQDFLMRHPFPGPGLAVRILGEISESKIKRLQEADFIFIEELKKPICMTRFGKLFACC